MPKGQQYLISSQQVVMTFTKCKCGKEFLDTEKTNELKKRLHRKVCDAGWDDNNSHNVDGLHQYSQKAVSGVIKKKAQKGADSVVITY